MADITVRGAGVFGLSVAWALIARGATVHVVDPAGVAAGASGGIVGALAPHVPEGWNPKKAFQFQSLIMAENWWAEIEAAGQTSSGYGRTGRIQPVMDEGEDLARARATGAQTLWQGQATWGVTDQPPAFAPPSPTGLWIYDTLTARLHPRQACHALAAAIRAKGGVITQDDSPFTGPTVWATGHAGLEEMTHAHSRMVGTGIKGQAVLLDHDARTAPQVFIDGLHIIPHADGTTAIGSTTEREFTDGTTTDAQCDALLAKARALMPALADAPERARWAGVRPRARTRAPMVGHHPFRAGDFVANGGFKIGFGMAPLAATQLAQLITTGENTLPPDFAPDMSL
ncbi:Glycine oxidase [Pseudooctadecabacter jejudonensis]|uniref:Glycine oxidase n=2 Tax=Pseudooctadecabacter jejudonensis TaxID=1391910 RepID=A0A1Y5S030_9RHOB|nr:Glycine oxidase [Pseudooctadecabacter jejudonensis]